MEQQCGRKICLKPSKAQVRTMYRMCAVSRRAYNWKLAEQNKAYEEAKANTPEGEKVKLHTRYTERLAQGMVHL